MPPARDEALLDLDPVLVGGTEDAAEGWADAAERWLGLRPGARVLEVGCGVGRRSAVLAEHGHLVTAVEGSARLLAAAEAHWRGRHGAAPGPRFLALEPGGVDGLGAFDAVILGGGSLGRGADDAEHLRVLLAAAGCVTEGGALLLETPNPFFWALRGGPRHLPPAALASEADLVWNTRLDALTGRIEESTWVFAAGERRELPRHSRRAWTPPELVHLARAAGLSEVRVAVSDGQEPPRPGGSLDVLRGAWLWTSARG